MTATTPTTPAFLTMTAESKIPVRAVFPGPAATQVKHEKGSEQRSHGFVPVSLNPEGSMFTLGGAVGVNREYDLRGFWPVDVEQALDFTCCLGSIQCGMFYLSVDLDEARSRLRQFSDHESWACACACAAADPRQAPRPDRSPRLSPRQRSEFRPPGGARGQKIYPRGRR